MGWKDAPIVGEQSKKPKWADAPVVGEKSTPSRLQSFAGKTFGFLANAAAQPILGPVGGYAAEKIAGKIAENPRGSALAGLEMLPAAGSIALPAAAAFGSGGTSAPASIALSGLGAAGGEGFRQVGRRILGEEPAPPVQNPIPFMKELPRIPGVSSEASNLIEQGVIGAGLEAGPRAIAYGLEKAAPLTGPIAKSAKKFASKVSSFFTGEKSVNFEKLIDDPSLILPAWMGGPHSLDDATQAYGKALDAVDISKRIDPLPKYRQIVEKTYETITTEPKIITDAMGKASEIRVPIQGLEDPATINAAVRKLSPQEAFDNYVAIRKIMETGVEGKDKAAFRSQVIYKEALKDYLSEVSAKFGPAIKEYARTATGASLKSILPKSKYGAPSIGRAGFSAPFFGALGYAAGGPIGAAAFSFLGTSPLMHSLGLAGAMGGAKGARAIATSPTAVKGLSYLIQKSKENK